MKQMDGYITLGYTSDSDKLEILIIRIIGSEVVPNF